VQKKAATRRRARTADRRKKAPASLPIWWPTWEGPSRAAWRIPHAGEPSPRGRNPGKTPRPLQESPANPRSRASRRPAGPSSRRRRLFGGEELDDLLPKITAAIPKAQRLHAELVTSLVIVTRRARDMIKNQATIGHHDFEDPEEPLRAASKHLKLARARLRWHRSQPGPPTLEFHQVVMKAIAARLLRDTAADQLAAERTGLSHVQNKTPIEPEDAFKVQLAWDLAADPYGFSCATIARILAAAELEPPGSDTASFPDRSPLENRIRKWLKRSRP
jgi:hypothetical protein